MIVKRGMNIDIWRDNLCMRNNLTMTSIVMFNKLDLGEMYMFDQRKTGKLVIQDSTIRIRLSNRAREWMSCLILQFGEGKLDWEDGS